MLCTYCSLLNIMFSFANTKTQNLDCLKLYYYKTCMKNTIKKHFKMFYLNFKKLYK